MAPFLRAGFRFRRVIRAWRRRYRCFRRRGQRRGDHGGTRKACRFCRTGDSPGEKTNTDSQQQCAGSEEFRFTGLFSWFGRHGSSDAKSFPGHSSESVPSDAMRIDVHGCGRHEQRCGKGLSKRTSERTSAQILRVPTCCRLPSNASSDMLVLAETFGDNDPVFTRITRSRTRCQWRVVFGVAAYVRNGDGRDVNAGRPLPRPIA